MRKWLARLLERLTDWRIAAWAAAEAQQNAINEARWAEEQKRRRKSLEESGLK